MARMPSWTSSIQDMSVIIQMKLAGTPTNINQT